MMPSTEILHRQQMIEAQLSRDAVCPPLPETTGSRCPVCGSWREAESCPRCEERARYRAAIERDPVGFFFETFLNCRNAKQRLLACYDAYCEKAERENDPMTAEFLRQSEREFFETREKGGGELG